MAPLPRQPEPSAHLVPTHREVMEVLWASQGPQSTARVHEVVQRWYPERAGRSHTTTATVLSQLEDAGYVSSQKRHGHRWYEPMVERAEMMGRLARGSLEAFCRLPLDGLFLVREVFAGLDPQDLVAAGEWLAAGRRPAPGRLGRAPHRRGRVRP